MIKMKVSKRFNSKEEKYKYEIIFSFFDIKHANAFRKRFSQMVFY